MGTIRFSLRLDKPVKKVAGDKQIFPIMLTYSVKGDRKRCNTGQHTSPDCWDDKEEKAFLTGNVSAEKKQKHKHEDLLNVYLKNEKPSPARKEDKAINRALSQIRLDIENLEEKHKVLGKQYSASNILDELNGTKKEIEIKEKPINEVYTFLKKYRDDNQEIRAKTSIAVYRQLEVHMQEFEKAKGEKISFDTIDGNFLDRFNKFLISTRKRFYPSKKKGGKGVIKEIRLNNTSAAKQISTLKTFLGYARKQGIIINERYKDFKVRRDEKEVVALTQSEFDAIYNLDLSHSRRLDEARDIFIFSCATGLRYSDLAQLDRDHIKGGKITFRVKKTKEPLSIPLNQYSYAILEKYKDRFKPLPVQANQKLISNQKLNEAIRGEDVKDKDGNIIRHKPGIIELAGIVDTEEIVKYYGARSISTKVERYRKITAHVGRKTFVTLSLSKGMSAEETMATTGHKDYRSFQRYVKVTDQRKAEAMRNAWGDIKPKMQAV